MGKLNLRDRELVALGAALAAGCAPCLDYHVPRAREAGLSDEEMAEAIALADKIRRVPADKALETATHAIAAPYATAGEESCAGSPERTAGPSSCC